MSNRRRIKPERRLRSLPTVECPPGPHRVEERDSCTPALEAWEAFLVEHHLELRCEHGHIEASRFPDPEHDQELMVEYVIRGAVLAAVHGETERVPAGAGSCAGPGPEVYVSTSRATYRAGGAIAAER